MDVNVVSEDKKDLTPEELEKVQAKLELKEQETKYFMNEKGSKLTISKEMFSKKTALYFKNCVDCEYTIDALTKCIKIMIEGCSNSKIICNGKITTNMVELWKCKDLNLELSTKVFTCQVDLSQNVVLSYSNKQMFQSVVWASTNNLNINFQHSTDKLVTGLNVLKEQAKYPDLNEQIDQFIVRLIEGAIVEERIIRLSNGFPTTEREATEFEEREKRNKEKAEQHIKKLVKSVEIKHRAATGTKKLGRNDMCSCGSNKKYKKCCGVGKA